MAVLFICFTNWLYGQELTYPYFYRIYFRDKGENNTENVIATDILSEKALERRHKAGIPVPDLKDIPVYKTYLDQISTAGFTLHCTSKWMNTALFKSPGPSDISAILDLPFVSDIKIVKKPAKKSSSNDKLNFKVEKADIPPFDRPLTMIGGNHLHNSGFDGKDILIAVLDGGFIYADEISSLKDLRNRNGIKGVWNFVENTGNVYGYHNHGTAVLSVLAGNIPGWISGTAPGADYLLLRTEDTFSEFPCEEDFWIAGAEFADSAGADIISSSLGYYSFDDPALNYSYPDLDGNKPFVTRGADVAASKGILVVNSAGNERTHDWQRIICPADGDSVIAVGAVDGDRYISTFSSAGPSSDGRVKPDLATMGVSVPVQTDPFSVERSSGTSFSCPVLSGMAACLMQAVPAAVNTDIISALQMSFFRINILRYLIPKLQWGLILLQVILKLSSANLLRA